MATPVSPHTLKPFEAIREDEMEAVEIELRNLTDMLILRHGFALAVQLEQNREDSVGTWS